MDTFVLGLEFGARHWTSVLVGIAFLAVFFLVVVTLGWWDKKRNPNKSTRR